MLALDRLGLNFLGTVRTGRRGHESPPAFQRVAPRDPYARSSSVDRVLLGADDRRVRKDLDAAASVSRAELLVFQGQEPGRHTAGTHVPGVARRPALSGFPP